jgi:ComF family protein
MKAEPDRQRIFISSEARRLSGLRAFYELALDLLFPPRCACCGRVDAVLCAACAEELSRADLIVLPPMPPIHSGAATGRHTGKLRRAVHALKYESDRSTAERLALPLAQRMAAVLAQMKWTIDIVVPVPLHISRLRERGYNQSMLLGVHVAHQFDLPIVPDALTRLRSTDSQVGRSSAERARALKNAFAAQPHCVDGKIILLIDDVCTTGTTLRECAQAALNAGARRVSCLTLACA